MQLNSINSKTAHEKLEYLRGYLNNLGSVAIAFSSGVDSTFLLKVAHDTLGERCAAITVKSRVFPERESREADNFCLKEGIRHIILESDELKIEGFRENPVDATSARNTSSPGCCLPPTMRVSNTLRRDLTWTISATIAPAFRRLRNFI